MSFAQKETSIHSCSEKLLEITRKLMQLNGVSSLALRIAFLKNILCYTLLSKVFAVDVECTSFF